MAKIMHLNKSAGKHEGFAIALCGKVLWPGEGALANAPVCGKCARKAGWRDGRPQGSKR